MAGVERGAHGTQKNRASLPASQDLHDFQQGEGAQIHFKVTSSIQPLTRKLSLEAVEPGTNFSSSENPVWPLLTQSWLICTYILLFILATFTKLGLLGNLWQLLHQALMLHLTLLWSRVLLSFICC